jgi:hypothetical protein
MIYIADLPVTGTGVARVLETQPLAQSEPMRDLKRTRVQCKE